MHAEKPRGATAVTAEHGANETAAEADVDAETVQKGVQKDVRTDVPRVGKAVATMSARR